MENTDNSRKISVAVLFGGRSSEHSVSLESAATVIERLDRTRFEPIPVGIDPSGRWYLYRGDPSAIRDGGWERGERVPILIDPSPNAPGLFLPADGSPAVRPDRIFPVLHGKNGEDGRIQAIARLAEIPLVGCGCLSSALCMDKARAHALAAGAGIRVPESVVVADPADPRAERFAREIGYPVFVKPIRAGSSVGVSKVSRPDGLIPALKRALEFDREAAVEQFIQGVEIGCALLGNPDQNPICGDLCALECDADFFDYTEKYTHRQSRLVIPAPLSEPLAAAVRERARTLYRLFDCRVFARIDFFLTPDSQIVFNEVNTIPGLTELSLYPAMMASAGIGMTDLLTRMIDLAG